VGGCDTSATGRAVSADPWPRGRQRDGGIDEVPLSERKGQLWLCGKHLVGPDPEAALERVQASIVVCLTQSHEVADRYPAYVDWLHHHLGERAIWLPIPDLDAPALQSGIELVARLDALVADGHGVIMHCAAGIGRSGTMATALLMWGGMRADAARELVAASRPMAGPEAGPQLEFLADLERSIGQA
jgi:protein-tyrosine phosphatase